jgi:transposase
VRKKLHIIIDEYNYELSAFMRNNLREMKEELCELDKKIDSCDNKIESLFKSNELCSRLATIPGIGILGATILSSILGTGGSFKNGRHFAAFLGLTPKQHSSGGKEQLLGISKGGDTYIRTLLIHGARSVLLHVNKKTDYRSCWLRRLKAKKGWNRAAVAFANKMARTAWALVHTNSIYDPDQKPILSNLQTVKMGLLTH